MATQEQTAKQIWDYFLGQGWTKEAIAGLLGNIQSESSVIADRWQGDIIGNMNGGYGLVQWTPATKYIDWATQNGLVYQDVISQCRRIQWEVERNIQWFPNPERLDLVNISFREFTQLKNVKLAAEYFIAFYEHPEYPNQPARARQAENWYNLLKNTSGVTPEQTKKGEISMQCLYTKPLSGGSAGIFYFNGIDTVHIQHMDTVKLLKQIYKANNGKDIPEYTWNSKEPWYARLEQVAPNRK